MSLQDPAYNPNHPMHRGRLDNFQGGGDNPVGYMQYVPFVAPIGVMESQAHASASYTANWVSSTSSIPPELRDEPEVSTVVGVERVQTQHDDCCGSMKDSKFSLLFLINLRELILSSRATIFHNTMVPQAN